MRRITQLTTITITVYAVTVTYHRAVKNIFEEKHVFQQQVTTIF